MRKAALHTCARFLLTPTPLALMLVGLGLGSALGNDSNIRSPGRGGPPSHNSYNFYELRCGGMGSCLFPYSVYPAAPSRARMFPWIHDPSLGFGPRPVPQPFVSGPPVGTVVYPYYTVRGPRDFLLANPPPLGP